MTERGYATLAEARKGLLPQLEEELRADFGPGSISKAKLGPTPAHTLVFRLATGPFAFQIEKASVDRRESGASIVIPMFARWAALELLFVPGLTLAECLALPVGADPCAGGTKPVGEALFGHSQPSDVRHHWSLSLPSSRVVALTAEVARAWKALIDGDPSVAAAHFIRTPTPLKLPARPSFPRANGPASRIGPLELVAAGLSILAGDRTSAAAMLEAFEALPDNRNLAARPNEISFGKTGPERAKLVDALHRHLDDEASPSTGV